MLVAAVEVQKHLQEELLLVAVEQVEH